MNNVAVACTGILGLLLFALGFLVSWLRFREQRLSGTNADPSSLFARAHRAHGNTAEFAPFLAVLFLYLGAHHPPPWAVWAMVAATVCRILIAAALLLGPTMDKPNPVRFIGASGTYLFGGVLCIALFRTIAVS